MAVQVLAELTVHVNDAVPEAPVVSLALSVTLLGPAVVDYH